MECQRRRLTTHPGYTVPGSLADSLLIHSYYTTIYYNTTPPPRLACAHAAAAMEAINTLEAVQRHPPVTAL